MRRRRNGTKGKGQETEIERQRGKRANARVLEREKFSQILRFKIEKKKY